MNQMRKKFDKEFKKKAVELSYARGNATEIAEELGNLHIIHLFNVA